MPKAKKQTSFKLMSNQTIVIIVMVVIFILLLAIIITLIVMTVLYTNHMNEMYSKSKKYVSDVIPLIPDETQMIDGSNYGTISYETFENIPKHSNGTKIPSYIFRTGELPLTVMHPDIVKLYEETISANSSYVHVYFDNNDRRSFIKRHYPQYLRCYDAIKPGAYKADIFRLCVIHKYGGVYMDMSMKLLKPLDEFLDRDKYQLVLATDKIPKNLFNGFIASCPNNVMMIECLEAIKENINNKYYGDTPLDVTGPSVIGKTFNEVLHRSIDSAFDESEYLLPSNILMKCLELDICVVRRNGFLKEKGSLDLLVQHKLKFAKHYGLYNSKKNLSYQTLWFHRQIYN